jgi:cytochrome b561
MREKQGWIRVSADASTRTGNPPVAGGLSRACAPCIAAPGRALMAMSLREEVRVVHSSIIASAGRYNPVSRLLHWAVAVLVLVVFPFGAVIKFVKDDVKLTFFAIHESLGFLILWLMLARILVRWLAPPPPEPPMPAIFGKAAALVHGGLYLALVLQPIFGFLATNAYGFPLKLFGLIDVWSPIGKSDWAPVFKSVHIGLGWAILVLFALHMAGVVFHHVVRRDATLYRML